MPPNPQSGEPPLSTDFIIPQPFGDGGKFDRRGRKLASDRMKMPSAPRLLRLYRFVRRRGVPHEETVVYPAVVALLCVTQSEHGNLPIWLSAYIIGISTLLCGAWLGFAWSKPRLGSLVIRSVIISALFVGGYAFGTHPDAPGTKAEYQQVFVQMARGFGLIWYFGRIFGSGLRECTITLFISERRRAAFEQRWPYRFWTTFLRHPGKKISYWLRLAVDREDKQNASTADLYMADFLKSLFTANVIFRYFGIMVAAIAIAFFGVQLSAFIKPLL